jgi:hypothetical protein
MNKKKKGEKIREEKKKKSLKKLKGVACSRHLF